jgi:hypothetical protein
MLTVIAAAGVLLALYAVVCAISPTCACGRCGGKRVTRTHLTQRTIPCPKCRATGRHYRPGAVIVHRIIRAVLAERRDRDKES